MTRDLQVPTTTIRVLGLDPGVSTGVACVEGWGTGWSFDYRKTVREECFSDALVSLAELIEREFITAEQDHVRFLVAMELLLAHGSPSNQEKAEAQGVIRETCRKYAIPLVTYSPATTRSLVIGDMKARETTIKGEAKRLCRLPATCKPAYQAHEADATLVALTALFKAGALYVIDPCEETP